MSVLTTLSPLSPSLFFDTSLTIKQRSGKRFARGAFLPNFTQLLNEDPFADLALFWSEQGLSLDLLVREPITGALFPHFRRGDSLELFIDTRKLTKTSVITRFCHHFLFLPEEVEGVQGCELTRFRADDSRQLADPSLFVIKTTARRLSYQMEIDIPSSAIYGYDPAVIDVIGVSYRINRKAKAPQHLALSSHLFALEKHPDFWATAFLKE